MGLRIQNNVEAFNAHRHLVGTGGTAAKSMERLSSGFRINRAADDAAGLAISEKLRAQIGGLEQAQRNAQDGISLVQTAEGALNEVHSMLQRVRELAVQYNNGTLVDDGQGRDHSRGRAAHQRDRAHRRPTTQFNGTTLLDSAADDHASRSAPTTARRSPSLIMARRRSCRRPVCATDRRGDAARRSSRRHRRRRSRPCRPPAATSARCRTASSTPSTTWRPTRRT